MSRSNNGSYNASFGASFQRDIVLRPSKPVLMISEQYFRDTVYVSDSLNSKLIITSIREVQDVNLATIIGSDGLMALQWYIENNRLTSDYKELVDYYIRPWLVYETAASVVRKSNFHIGNKGNVQSEEVVEAKRMADYYQNLAGSNLRRLTDYLSQNYDTYKDIIDTTSEIYSHLRVTVDTGIYLGGPSMKWSGEVDHGKFR